MNTGFYFDTFELKCCYLPARCKETVKRLLLLPTKCVCNYFAGDG